MLYLYGFILFIVFTGADKRCKPLPVVIKYLAKFQLTHPSRRCQSLIPKIICNSRILGKSSHLNNRFVVQNFTNPDKRRLIRQEKRFMEIATLSIPVAVWAGD